MADTIEKFDLECDCKHQNHSIRFQHYKNDEGGHDLSVNATMQHFKPWYKRLGVGICYILGIDNTFVTHVELYISDKAKIKEFVDRLNKLHDEFESTEEQFLARRKA